MIIARRHLVVAGALVLGVSVLLLSSRSIAQSTDAPAVAEAVAALTRAMLAADRAQLETLVADQLSYGHSGGVIQTKAEFVDVIASKKTIYKSIVLSDQTVARAKVAASRPCRRSVSCGFGKSRAPAGSFWHGRPSSRSRVADDAA